MKSIVRLGQKALVMGVAIAGTMMGVVSSASALPVATVLQKLSPIPMFMLVNDQGQPIFATIKSEDGKASEVTGVFVSLADAQTLVNTRRTEAQKLLDTEKAKPNADPKVVQQLTDQSSLWKEAHILPIGLDKIYQFAQSAEAKDLAFKFLPTEKEMSAAAQVTQKENFPGVPLFFLSMKTKDASGKEVMTFPTMTTDAGQGAGQIPVFFEVDPILKQLDSFPDKKNLSINVMPLEVFISKMLDDKLSPEEQKFLGAMTLIPSAESSQLIQGAMQQQQQKQPQAQGQPQVKPQLPPQVQPQAQPKPKP